MTTKWTIERETRLAELWADGHSCTAIAAELGGLSDCPDGGRSAVMGKIKRLKLPPPSKKIGNAERPRKVFNPLAVALRPTAPRREKSVQRPPGPQSTSISEERRVAAEKRIAARLANAENEKPGETALTLNELSDSVCHWPIGDPLLPAFRFCGAKPAFEGSQYCQHHSRIAFAPKPPPSTRPTYRS